jgi:ABC-2 type transport system permease protein
LSGVWRSAGLIVIYLRISAMNELQYRVNFFVQLLQTGVALATGLVGLWLVFNQTTTLGGWSSAELLAVMGVYTIMGGLVSAVIQPNMEKLMDDIQRGNLDFLLTKPEDPQLLISVRTVAIWEFVNVIAGLIVLVIALARLDNRIGIGHALAFVWLLMVGGVMIYCFWLILTTAAFWVVRIDEMANLFQGVFAAGRYPVGIYPGWLKNGLTFLVPVAFAVTIPSEALTGRLDWPTGIGATGLACLFAVVARGFWRIGLRHYSGASS